MRRHWFFILLSLSSTDRHGSGIMRDVLELTDGDLKLWPVTLYGSLDELREQSLIRELDKPPAGEDDNARRRWFRITADVPAAEPDCVAHPPIDVVSRAYCKSFPLKLADSTRILNALSRMAALPPPCDTLAAIGDTVFILQRMTLFNTEMETALLPGQERLVRQLLGMTLGSYCQRS